MTPEEFIAWQKVEAEKYKASVAAKWAAAERPTPREMVVINALFPGYNGEVETFLDISINESARKQARKVIKALEEFDGKL